MLAVFRFQNIVYLLKDHVYNLYNKVSDSKRVVNFHRKIESIDLSTERLPVMWILSLDNKNVTKQAVLMIFVRKRLFMEDTG